MQLVNLVNSMGMSVKAANSILAGKEMPKTAPHNPVFSAPPGMLQQHLMQSLLTGRSQANQHLVAPSPYFLGMQQFLQQVSSKASTDLFSITFAMRQAQRQIQERQMQLQQHMLFTLSSKCLNEGLTNPSPALSAATTSKPSLASETAAITVASGTVDRKDDGVAPPAQKMPCPPIHSPQASGQSINATFPCRARGMTSDHNSEVGVFVLPRDV